MPASIIPCGCHDSEVPEYIKQVKNFHFIHHIRCAFEYLKQPLIQHPFVRFKYPKDFCFQDFYKLFGNLISSQPSNYEDWVRKVNLFSMNNSLEFHGRSSTDLELALKNGDKQMVQKALEDQHRYDERKRLPLQYIISAKSFKYKEIVQLLTNNGYDINPATFTEAIKSRNVELLKILLDNGANVNLEGSHGWTPLEQAIKCGGRVLVEYLVKQGAKIDVRNDQNRTLMELTALKGFYKILNKMFELTYGKSLKSQEVNEEMMFLKVLSLARKSPDDNLNKKHRSTLKELESWDESQRSQIVTKNICNNGKLYSPFSIACEYGNTILVQFFIKVCKANIETRSRHGLNKDYFVKTTPIGIAAARGHFKIVELLNC